VNNGAHIETAVQLVDEPIERLFFVGHGWPQRWLAKWRGLRVGRHVPPRVISDRYLCELLASRVAPDVHVAFAACWTASNRRPWLRNPRLYGPGGQHSLCAQMYRGLVAVAPHATVIGHTRRGPTTEAPHLRAWGGRYGVESDGRGVSVLDHYLGPGAHLERPKTILWRRLLAQTDEDRNTGAELLLAGRPVPWLRRRG
jgi:hypothetical protein